MTITEITLIGIFIIEAIRLILTIAEKMKDDKKIPFKKEMYG